MANPTTSKEFYVKTVAEGFTGKSITFKSLEEAREFIEDCRAVLNVDSQEIFERTIVTHTGEWSRVD